MREINPKETTRAYAFELWMKAPMPMVTFFKTLDVSRLVKISKKSGMKFNMLMCWCIGKAASSISKKIISQSDILPSPSDNYRSIAR